MYDWPASKFQALYAACIKRKVADELALRRLLEVAAIWGNSNMQTEKEDLRPQYQEEIDNNYMKVIDVLYGGVSLEEKEEFEIDEEDPFWQAMEKGLEKRQLPGPEV